MDGPPVLQELAVLRKKIFETDYSDILPFAGEELYSLIIGHPVLRENLEEKVFYFDYLRRDSDFLRLESELVDKSVAVALSTLSRSEKDPRIHVGKETKWDIKRLTNPELYHRFGELGAGIYKLPFNLLREHCKLVLEQYEYLPGTPQMNSLKEEIQHRLIQQPFHAKLKLFEYLVLAASTFGHYELIDAKRLNPTLFESGWMPDKDECSSDAERENLSRDIQRKIQEEKGFTIFEKENFLYLLKEAALYICDTLPQELSALERARVSLPPDCILLDECIALQLERV